MNKSEKFWDRLSHNYDQTAENDAAHYRESIQTIREHLDGSQRVLDIGCATGIISLEIAGEVKEVQGIDISSKMIAEANRKAAELGIQNSTYTQTTLFDERFEPQSFDAILAFGVLHYLEDAPQALERMDDLLKTGGLLIAETPCLGEKGSFVSFMISLAAKLGVLPRMHFFKVSELEELVSESNFQVLERKEYAYHSVAEFFFLARKI